MRDWIYVLDHSKAVDFVLHSSAEGENYKVGGGNGKANIEITHKILELLGKDESMME